jgi:hypothetical protein
VIEDQRFATEEEKSLIKKELKHWYQHSFQKNNRWNRAELKKQIKDYSDHELEKLGACFELLFNTNNQYHRVFHRYLKSYQNEKEIAKSNLGTARLKVSQNTFEEIIQYFGDLKRDGKIMNTNKQIARVLKRMLDPDTSLEEITIMDRLTNKKGYY